MRATNAVPPTPRACTTPLTSQEGEEFTPTAAVAAGPSTPIMAASAREMRMTDKFSSTQGQASRSTSRSVSRRWAEDAFIGGSSPSFCIYQ